MLLHETKHFNTKQASRQLKRVCSVHQKLAIVCHVVMIRSLRSVLLCGKEIGCLIRVTELQHPVDYAAASFTSQIAIS